MGNVCCGSENPQSGETEEPEYVRIVGHIAVSPPKTPRQARPTRRPVRFTLPTENTQEVEGSVEQREQPVLQVEGLSDALVQQLNAAEITALKQRLLADAIATAKLRQELELRLQLTSPVVSTLPETKPAALSMSVSPTQEGEVSQPLSPGAPPRSTGPVAAALDLSANRVEEPVPVSDSRVQEPPVSAPLRQETPAVVLTPQRATAASPVASFPSSPSAPTVPSTPISPRLSSTVPTAPGVASPLSLSPTKGACSLAGCTQAGKIQCPLCSKPTSGLPKYYACSEEHWRALWPEHSKLVHSRRAHSGIKSSE